MKNTASADQDLIVINKQLRLKEFLIGGLLLAIILVAGVAVIRSVNPNFMNLGNIFTKRTQSDVQIQLSSATLSHDTTATFLKTDVVFVNNTNRDLWFMDYDLKLKDQNNLTLQPDRIISNFTGQYVLKAGTSNSIHVEFSFQPDYIPQNITFANSNFPETYTFYVGDLRDSDCCQETLTVTPTAAPTEVVRTVDPGQSDRRFFK
jgi:hypothetical protein